MLFWLQILLVSQAKLQESSTGHVIDLVSNDLKRIENDPEFLPLSSLSLIEIPVIACIVLYFIGREALIPILVFMSAVPCIYILSHLCAILRRKTAEQSDRRITLMDELVSAIRAIKANAWEENYRDNVKRIRG